MKKAFTLVELLIVIALIAILSVAVLATINPIEQANKAKDASVQNDAAEVMNAYERYYANAQAYPWMAYGVTKATVEDSILLRSDTIGFGVCDAGVVTQEADEVVTGCATTSDTPGLLISTDELKTAFMGKDSFQRVIDAENAHPEDSLWLFKEQGSGGGIYVCYIPKAKSNRESATNTLWCLTPSGTRLAAGTEGCAIVPTTGDGATMWGTPDSAIADAASAIFKCVP